jgi:hypothetical protein
VERWSQLATDATLDSLRARIPNSAIFDLATEVTTEDAFYAKLAHSAYRATAASSSHILSEVFHYDPTYLYDTPAKLYHPNGDAMTLQERRVLYELKSTGYDHFDVYMPVLREANIDIPIYVAIRGTQGVFDYWKDLNLFANHLGLTGSDYSGFYNALTPIINEVNNLLLNSQQKIVFVGHSLGALYGLHVFKQFYTYPGGIYEDRMKKLIMFNPYITVDDVYTQSLSLPDEYKNKIIAHIVDADPFAAIYKNHPIGPVKIYDNVLPLESDWLTQPQMTAISWANMLDLRNHRIIAFLQEDNTSYPIQTYIHYEAKLETQYIQTRKSFKLISLYPDLVDEHLQLSYTSSNTMGSRFGLDSKNVHSIDLNIFNMDIQTGSTSNMIYRDGKWSLPLIINNDTSSFFYIFRSRNHISSDPYYYLSRVLSDTFYYIRPYMKQLDNDYGRKIRDQYEFGNRAFELDTSNPYGLAVNSDHHMSLEWNIYNVDDGVLPLESGLHAGHDDGLRRALSTTTYTPVKMFIILASATNTGQYISGYNTSSTHDTLQIGGKAIFTHQSPHWDNLVDRNVEMPAIHSTYPDEYVWELEQHSNGTYKLTNTEIPELILDNLTIEFNGEWNNNINGNVNIKDSDGKYLSSISVSNWGKVQFHNGPSGNIEDWIMVTLSTNNHLSVPTDLINYASKTYKIYNIEQHDSSSSIDRQLGVWNNSHANNIKIVSVLLPDSIMTGITEGLTWKIINPLITTDSIYLDIQSVESNPVFTIATNVINEVDFTGVGDNTLPLPTPRSYQNVDRIKLEAIPGETHNGKQVFNIKDPQNISYLFHKEHYTHVDTADPVVWSEIDTSAVSNNDNLTQNKYKWYFVEQ